MHMYKLTETKSGLTFGDLKRGDTYVYTEDGAAATVTMKVGDAGRATMDGHFCSFVEPHAPVARVPGFFHPCSAQELEAVKSGELVPCLVPATVKGVGKTGEDVR